MLVIRAEQFDRMGEAIGREFRRVLARSVAAELEAVHRGLPSDFDGRIDELVERAAEYRLTGDRHIRKYVSIEFRHPRSIGHGGDPEPAGRIMRTFAWAAEERLCRLEAWAVWIEENGLYGVE